MAGASPTLPMPFDAGPGDGHCLLIANEFFSPLSALWGTHVNPLPEVVISLGLSCLEVPPVSPLLVKLGLFAWKFFFPVRQETRLQLYFESNSLQQSFWKTWSSNLPGRAALGKDQDELLHYICTLIFYYVSILSYLWVIASKRQHNIQLHPGQEPICCPPHSGLQHEIDDSDWLSLVPCHAALFFLTAASYFLQDDSPKCLQKVTSIPDFSGFAPS